jgi:hypothetical protein
VLAVRGRNSSGGFLVDELVIPGRITRASVGIPGMKNPPDGNKSMITYYEGFLPPMNFFLNLN